MKRIVLPALVAAALLGALAVKVFGPSSARPGAGTAAASPGEAAPGDHRPSAALAPAAAIAHDERALAQRAPDLARSAPSPSAAAPAGSGFVLRVVLKGDESPVAGAEVLAYAGTGEEADFEDLQLVDAWMEEHGTPLVTDERGEVRVPAGLTEDAYTRVLARREGLWGRKSFRAPKEGEEGEEAQRTLALAPDVELAVLTVDAGGHPVAGVGMTLDRATPQWQSEVQRTTTGEDGRGRLRHVQEHGTEQKRSSSGSGMQWLVVADVLTQTEIAREVDLASPPTEVLRFVLPATGSVAVRLLDADGRPWTRAATVTLEAIRPGEPRLLSPFGSERRTSTEAKAKDGVARFPFVGVGFELALSALRQEGPLPARAFGSGPERAGQEVRRDVVFGAEGPVIELRALGGGGAPLAGETLLGRIEVRSQYMSNEASFTAVAEADGRVRIDLDAAWGEGDRRVLHLLRGTREAPTASAQLDLSRKLEPGLNDLGDVYLAAPGIFVAGRVVDGAGQPVANAKLVLRRHNEESAYWENVWSFDHQSGADGTFDVRTAFEGQSFQLGAEKPGLTCVPVDFTPGEPALTIVLTGTGSVRGSLRVDPDVPLDKLKLIAGPAEENREEHFLEWNNGRTTPDESGGFVLANLLPGVYDVALETDGGEVLHRVEDVVVRGGEENADPRLQGLDLRGRLHALHITLVAPEGKSVAQGSYTFGPAGGELSSWGWFNEPEFDAVSTDRALDLDLTVPGYEMIRLRGITEDQTLELSSGLSVRLVVRGDAPVPEPPFYVKPTLVPADGSPHSFDWAGAALDESREVVVRAVAPGKQKVEWIVERRSQNSATATTVDATPELFVEVRPGVADQVFEIALGREALEKILAALN